MPLLTDLKHAWDSKCGGFTRCYSLLASSVLFQAFFDFRLIQKPLANKNRETTANVILRYELLLDWLFGK